MKKLIYLVAVTAFLLSSCESFIETNNKSNVDADTFYKTAAGFASLRNAAYSSLRMIYSNEPWMFEAGVDLYASGRNQLPEIGRYNGLTPQDSEVKAFYVRCYSGIQLANGVVYYSELTEQNSNVAQYVAEARFLRAFYHFLLVQQFGGVAIMDEYVNEAYFEYPRASVEEVYNFIISEMEAAKPALPASNPQSTGEITQQTVNHFLAKVYLTRGWDLNNNSDFTQAATYAEQAINGQGLNLSFEELFNPKNEVNEEVLWSVKYDEDNVYDRQNDGNMQWSYFASYLGGTEAGHKYTASTLTPTWRMHEIFEEGDARYEATYMLTLYESYWSYYYDNPNTTPVAYYYPTRFDVADTTAWRNANYEYRKDAIIIPMTEETVTPTGAPTTYETQAGSGGDVFGVPAFKKFDYTPDDRESIIFSNRASFRDVILARLGETYLIAAEAYLQAGNPAAAAEKINVVRSRAAKDGYNMAVSSSDINIDFILDERARELAGEYHRWTDLRRTKKVIEYCMKYNPELARLGEGIFGTNGSKALYRPIPQDAIDLNHSEVAQNPGY